MTVLRHVLARPHDAAHAVLVEGEPGIGKTRLLREFADVARSTGARILRGGVTDAESDISWAGLSALLDGVDQQLLDVLEPGQRHALDRATGRRSDGAVDADDVAWVLAELTSRAAADAPLVLVLDDLHWFDRASSGALGVAVRANLRRPLTVVAARRLGTGSALELERIDGLPLERLRLGGLSVSGVYELLAESGLSGIRRPDVLRIHELSQGNPLFAVELAELHRSGRGVGDGPATVGTLATAYLAQLDEHTIDVARVCALLAQPTIDDVRAVAGRHADDALISLERAGVIACDGRRLEFTHPLRRAGVLETVGELERRRYHRRIADAVDDPVQAVVHRSEATESPDRTLADELERVADQTAEQGVPDLAAVRYRRAAELTPGTDATDRWRRLHRAVRCSIAAGDESLLADETAALLASAPSEDDLLAAALDMIEVVHRTHGFEAACEWAPIGRGYLAHTTRHQAVFLERVVRIEQLRDIPEAARLAGEARALASTVADAALLGRAQVLDASAAILAGQPVDLGRLPAVAPGVSGPGMDASMFLAELLVWTHEFDRAIAVLRPMEAAARAAGRGTQLVRVLSQLGDLHLRRGNWDDGVAALEEAIEIGDLVGYDVGARCDLAWIHAAQGHRELAHEVIAIASRSLDTAPEVHRMQILARRGFVALAEDEWHAAATDLTEASSVASSIGFVGQTVLPLGHDLIEALVQIGRLDAAREYAERLMAIADRGGRCFELALATRSRALVALAGNDHDAAARDAIEAIRLHDEAPSVPFEAARARLVAAGALRRLGRRREAREQAELAAGVFETLGAAAFARRARAELDRLRTRRTPTGLTPTEAQVAHLAAAGRTNAEIASELVVSVRTVESNLTRVYRKLGVRSRTELATRLTAAR